MNTTAVPKSLRTMLAKARNKHASTGQVILHEGDQTSEVFFIRQGIVKLYDIDSQGNEKILHLLKQPNSIPFSFFSGGSTHNRWYYTALTDCDLAVVPAAKLRALMAEDEAAMHFLVSTFSKEVHEVLTRLNSLGKSDVYAKLAAVLMYLATYHAQETRAGWWRVPFAVNQQLMADMMGVTRETTSTAMKQLLDKRIIRRPRVNQLEIHQSRIKKFYASVMQ